MNLVACPKCNSRFDVSTLQPGSTFVCGTCKNVLQVPRQPVAAAPPPPARPPARPSVRPAAPRPPAGRAPARPAAPGPRVDSRRAGGGTTSQRAVVAPPPPPAAAPPGRAPGGRAGGRAGGRSAGRGAGRETGGKSNLPLVLGGVAALVVVVIIVAILAISGSDDPVVTPGGPGQVGPVAGGQPAEPTMTEKIAKLDLEYLGATAQKNMAAVESIYRRAKALTASGLARKTAQWAVTVDGNLAWANEELGRKDLRKVFERIPAEDLLDTYPNPAYKQLIEAREYSESYWGPTERYEELENCLREATAHGEKLKNDRGYLDEYVIRLNVSKDPLYKDYAYRVSAKGPYIMFVEHTGSESDSEKARQIVDRNLNVLTALYRDFRNVFGKHFEMPEVKSFDQASMRTLKLWTFFSVKSFQEYQEKLRMPLPPGVAAYYRPANQWITLFESPGGGGGGSDFNINKIFHEGTHQLVHLYTKVLIEKKIGDEILWDDPRTHSRLHWFQEGIAELFGSAKKVGDDWETMVPYIYRMREWWMTRSNKLSEWTFEELLSIKTSGELQNRASRKGLNQGGRLSSLFYAQAWSWVYFLWNFENGKYRDKFVEYAAKEFHGISGPEEFAKVWGAGPDYDWTPVKNEWMKYTEKLGKEMGIWQ